MCDNQVYLNFSPPSKFIKGFYGHIFVLAARNHNISLKTQIFTAINVRDRNCVCSGNGLWNWFDNAPGHPEGPSKSTSRTQTFNVFTVNCIIFKLSIMLVWKMLLYLRDTTEIDTSKSSYKRGIDMASHSLFLYETELESIYAMWAKIRMSNRTKANWMNGNVYVSHVPFGGHYALNFMQRYQTYQSG